MKDPNTASDAKETKTALAIAIVVALLLIGGVFFIAQNSPEADDIVDSNTGTFAIWNALRPSFFSGKADLSVTILETGFINSSGEFTLADTIPIGALAGIRVEIENTGKKMEGSWHIEADLPTTKPFTYRSDYFGALEKKEVRTFLLTSDSIQKSGQGVFVVRVESDEDEGSLSNNTATSTVEIAN